MRKINLLILLAAVLAVSMFFVSGAATEQKKSEAKAAKNEATAKTGVVKTIIDIGITVSDMEKSVKFYKEVLGFTEVPGKFFVDEQMGGEVGLTDYKSFHLRMFKLGDDPAATSIKLIEFPDAKKVDRQFIHSSLGPSYLTIFVWDTAGILEKAAKMGLAPVKKPYLIPGENAYKYLTLLRDPDGNLIEMVEPKR